MNFKKIYLQLVNLFSSGELGNGFEPTFPGKSYQPMTYGLLLSSEILYNKVYPNKKSKERINELLNWLIENFAINEEKFLGGVYHMRGMHFKMGQQTPKITLIQ